jgi:DNA mismatch endonuclease (patch repair protein)
MTDVFDKQKRSEVMSKIRSKNTKLELTLRKALFKVGLRGYRLDVKLPGSPDIAFPRAKVAVFVDGCFWHGCPLCYSAPETNSQFWRNKIIENHERDQRANKNLDEIGWTVIRVWEHEIGKHLDDCVAYIKDIVINKIS